ncbi:MAG: hypothetical protein EON49_02250 [Acidovorax sp.]|nr:MAG: hypothetical protein EON49_02250 [Acidovorax sp.]
MPETLPPSAYPRYRSTLFSIALMLVSTALTAAPVVRPPSGTDVDETRMVSQRTAPPQPCIAVPLGRVTVLLDPQELAVRAAARPAQWTTESERMALIEGQRAAALLAAATATVPPNGSTATAHGCSHTVTTLDAQAQYTLLAALEAGSATVLVAGDKRPAAAVAIRYLGTRCGPLCGRGLIMVSVPGQSAPFLVQDWWVS